MESRVNKSFSHSSGGINEGLKHVAEKGITLQPAIERMAKDVQHEMKRLGDVMLRNLDDNQGFYEARFRPFYDRPVIGSKINKHVQDINPKPTIAQLLAEMYNYDEPHGDLCLAYQLGTAKTKNK